MTGHETQDSGPVAKRPMMAATSSASDMPNLLDLNDRRTTVFWLVELAGAAAFCAWLVLATSISKTPAALDVLPAIRATTALPTFNALTNITLPTTPQTHEDASSYRASVDVWVALSLIPVLDAFVVVCTFNRALMREFHYALSQRMMLLASMLSFAVFCCDTNESTFASRNPAACLGLGLAVYLAFGYVLEMFEPRWSAGKFGPALREGSVATYTKTIACLEVSWPRALFLAGAVGGMGLFLTSFVPSPWSALVPIAQILFESLFLSLTKAKKSPRYLALVSPPYIASVCVHWGVAPLRNAGCTLAIRPETFIALVLAGRLLSDAHLSTNLRGRTGLHWARGNVIVSTRTLVGVLGAMLLAESVGGVPVITHVKPIAVLVGFPVALAGFLALPAFDIAMKSGAWGLDWRSWDWRVSLSIFQTAKKVL
ncbi:hypothetical protein BJY00DRAFT_108964 [Aspergillus carlsbadensis]|nr:hypothetical protein BJY00DRAFT_108964 [Aspergillus carlsbadensis]